MDKEDIKRAAREAIKDLQLDCEITEVTKPIGKNNWCIQFSGNYGQFCDAFQDKAGEENSARVVKEKIKRFFLKQRKPARIVRGRTSSARTGRGGEISLLSTLLDAGEGALKQASRIATEVVERAADLNRTVLETEAEWVETVSPTMAEMIRPDSGGQNVTGVFQPRRTVEAASAQPPKKAAQPIKSERKTKAKTGRKTTKKNATSKARTTKKTGARTSKKASAATAKKSAAKKRGAKTGKKTGKKKSSSKKSRAVIRKFY